MVIIHSIPIKGAFAVLKVKEDCLLVVNVTTTGPFICLHMSSQEATFYVVKRKSNQKRYKGRRYHVL